MVCKLTNFKVITNVCIYFIGSGLNLMMIMFIIDSGLILVLIIVIIVFIAVCIYHKRKGILETILIIVI